MIACRSEPAPESLVFVTVNVAPNSPAGKSKTVVKRTAQKTDVVSSLIYLRLDFSKILLSILINCVPKSAQREKSAPQAQRSSFRCALLLRHDAPEDFCKIYAIH